MVYVERQWGSLGPQLVKMVVETGRLGVTGFSYRWATSITPHDLHIGRQYHPIQTP